jgi:hypothetical protein
MKPDRFEIPGSLLIERSLRREGPSPVYVAWKPHTSRLFYEKKPLLKFCKWPASTQSGVALREWLSQFDDVTVQEPESVAARIKAEGFGPEAHDEPNSQTRTVI